MLEILNPSLSVSLSSDDEIFSEYSFLLEDVTSRHFHQLNRKDQSLAWRVYKIRDGDAPPPDEEEIERMKAVVGQWAPKGPMVRVDLQLFADDGLFTLLKPTRLEFNISEDNS